MMNEEFLARIQSYIPEEYEAFLASFETPLGRGVRINAAKTDPAATAEKLGLHTPSPFALSTWQTDHSWGLHPWHAAGWLYMQELSAGSAVGQLDLQPDDIVLDLCAAPGSKSTQILPYLKDGYLVSNEYDSRRAQILLSNMERMGAVNFAVTNMDAASLCRQFKGCFDKVLVDAPCSGEGMMKKHEAARDWSLDHVLECAALQKDILDHAITALKPGGILVYSTCTYAAEENEEQIAALLKNHPEMELEAITASFGRPGLDNEAFDARKVRRIFPMDGGEGHFIARLKKTEGTARSLPYVKSRPLDQLVQDFLASQIRHPFQYYETIKQKDKIQVFGMNVPFVKFKGRVLRQGVYLGDLVKKRFEPAHAFFLNAFNSRDFLHPVEVDLKQMDDFLHGLTLDLPAVKGYVPLSYQQAVFGFGKSDGRQIKNKYPKGLRLLPNSHLQPDFPKQGSTGTEG